jgi:hypothetical protein
MAHFFATRPPLETVHRHGPRRATALGYVYIVSRLLYPWLFYIGHPWLQLSTVPGYLVVFANFWGAVAGAAA